MGRRVFTILLVLLAAGILLSNASPASANGFQRDEYGVDESAEYVQLAVLVKFCCPMGQGQIDYHTSDLTAVAGQDYQETSGTVTFVTGTYGRQDIRVPIFSDELSEGEEQFEVKLTNYRGSFVEKGYETAIVRVFDDYPKHSSSSSALPSQSDQQTSESRVGSPTSVSGADESLVSTNSGSQTGDANSEELNHLSEPGLGREAKPSRAIRDGNGPSSPSLLGLGALLFVIAVVVGFGFKRLGRKQT